MKSTRSKGFTSENTYVTDNTNKSANPEKRQSDALRRNIEEIERSPERIQEANERK